MKDILSEHFDRSPVRTEACTQYYQGEYWGPKHQDSLAFLLEITPNKSKAVNMASGKIRAAISELESAQEDLDSQY